MGLGIRKWIARSISKIEPPEVYPLHRWMRSPEVNKKTVEKLYGGMGDVSYIELFFPEPSFGFTGKFFRGTSDENYTLILFPKVKSSPAFFVLRRVKSSPFFFSFGKIKLMSTQVTFPDVEYYEAEGFSLFHDGETQTLSKEFLFAEETRSHTKELSSPIKYQKVDGIQFEVDVECVNLLDWGVETVSLQYFMDTPQIEDILSTFIPTVEKIDLLDKESFSFKNLKIIYDPLTSFDIKRPDVVFGEYSDLDISVAGPMFYYQDFKFKASKGYLIQSPALNTSELTTQKQENVNIIFTEGKYSPAENFLADSLANKTLFRFLEPVYELTDALKGDILAPLPLFQQEGAEFLFNSSLAFFYDDFELGKEHQAIFALKMLLRIRAVKNSLIVTTKHKECIRDPRDLTLLKGLWQGGAASLLNNYSFAFFDSAKNIKNINSFNNFINIITYETFEECFASSALVPEDLNVFDCIIIDDITDEALDLKSLNHLNSNLVCNYFWFLSDFDDPSFIKRVANLFPDKEIQTLGRNKNSVAQLPAKAYYDFVIELDSENSKIPDELVAEAKDKIGALVDSGNVMRIQPAVFQLIHDSQRKTNFNLNSPDYGNKSILLKYHIDRILNRYDRLLIYTQFEDSGIQQLSEFLKANEIEFVKFDLSDSANTIADKLAHAKSYNGKLVYLTNLKQKGLFFKFPNVSHLINFDNWWNPIARYSIEDNLNKGKEKSISVYNYYFNNTFEYNFLEKLSSMGLKDKNVISSLTADNFYNIISETLWCKILGIEPEEAAASDNDDYSVKSLKDLVNYSESFLKKLNLDSIESQVDILNYSSTTKAVFNKSGEKINVIAKCVFARNLSSNYVKEIIKDYLSENINNRIFLIASGTIESPTTALPNNFSLIDGEKLKSYLNTL